MLQYLNQGYRTFAKNPIPPHVRLNWEFYAVVEGKCAPVLSHEAELPLKSRQLWVFAPETSHGWRGEEGKDCRVFCYHFAFVPPPLDAVVRRGQFHVCDINDKEIQQLVSMGQELRRHFEHPTNLTHVRFYQCLIELTLLALKNVAEEPLPELAQTMNFKVDAALAWYVEHLMEAPTIDQVAAQMHSSASHLRKMFMLTRQESPLSAFKKVRMQRAMELLSESNIKLETIAGHCGYVAASDFCRAFRNEFGISPSDWRRNNYGSISNAQVKPNWLGNDAWDLKKPFKPAG